MAELARLAGYQSVDEMAQDWGPVHARETWPSDEDVSVVTLTGYSTAEWRNGMPVNTGPLTVIVRGGTIYALPPSPYLDTLDEMMQGAVAPRCLAARELVLTRDPNWGLLLTSQPGRDGFVPYEPDVLARAGVSIPVRS